MGTTGLVTGRTEDDGPGCDRIETKLVRICETSSDDAVDTSNGDPVTDHFGQRWRMGQRSEGLGLTRTEMNTDRCVRGEPERRPEDLRAE